MNVEEMFEKHENEYLSFEMIPVKDRLSEDRKLCGLLYVYTLMKDPKKFWLATAHDAIFVAALDWLKELTEENVIYLQRCGIHNSSEYDCLCLFC